MENKLVAAQSTLCECWVLGVMDREAIQSMFVCVWYMCVYVCRMCVAYVCVVYVCVCVYGICVYLCMCVICACVCVCVCVWYVRVTHIDLPEGGLHHLGIEDPPAYKNDTCLHI